MVNPVQQMQWGLGLVWIKFAPIVNHLRGSWYLKNVDIETPVSVQTVIFFQREAAQWRGWLCGEAEKVYESSGLEGRRMVPLASTHHGLALWSGSSNSVEFSTHGREHGRTYLLCLWHQRGKQGAKNEETPNFVLS